ncbi:hypothetical protein CPAR01_02378 [Colletotrichum paranaense]|uniref:Uncharacterized protein n=2 Tax=Colletotrichum acutatum species complex TaxID=2707335 RepID=A0AAI9Z6V7_9PEZI|nr:uncharacterized protein CCOS01_03679 [Colletotrichum costaricense]XP_060353994.1 uncharacterized protein CPAR01_02378 [Colletotrichum paranaense]KAK1534927.1 hypothetical protein CCOS01_03679 [Colletotrichum costaricense]KAK1544876.1 hypothetical protein CPAR01_02378 [Colletotrichum paranaense]
MRCHHTAESDAVSSGHLTASSPSPSPDLRPVPLPVEGEHDKTSDRKKSRRSWQKSQTAKRKAIEIRRFSCLPTPVLPKRTSAVTLALGIDATFPALPSFTQGGMIRNLTGARMGQDEEKRRKNMGPEQSAVRDLPSTTAKLNGYFHFSLPQRVFHPAIRPIQPHQTTPNPIATGPHYDNPRRYRILSAPSSRQQHFSARLSCGKEVWNARHAHQAFEGSTCLAQLSLADYS